MAEPCPIGTYLSSTGASLKSECVSCDAGSSCEHRGLTAPGDPCEAGYFCVSGSSEVYAEECPEGYKCPAGSAAAVPCPIGTYQPNAI